MHDEQKNSKSQPQKLGGLSRVVLTRGYETYQYEFEEVEPYEIYKFVLEFINSCPAYIVREGETLRVTVVGPSPSFWGCA